MLYLLAKPVAYFLSAIMQSAMVSETVPTSYILDFHIYLAALRYFMVFFLLFYHFIHLLANLLNFINLIRFLFACMPS